MSGFDWPRLLQFGLRGLGLQPGQFWALTPAELLIMAGHGEGADHAMTRAGLDALLRDFPDQKKDDECE